MRRLLRPVALASSILAVPVVGPAHAQDAPPSAGYEGVTPGSGTPPAAQRLARRPRPAILTWPGFTTSPGGGSRFFVQTTHPVVTELRAGADRVEVVFRNTAIHLANSRRWLETRHFETPVTRARLERRGRDMVLVMHLRGASTPQITSGAGEGGFHFTYVDFPAGHWLPDEPEPAPIPQGSVGIVRSGDAPPPASTAPAPTMDDERPPPVRRGPEP